jgi:homoserine O-acetyltransferase
MAASLDNGAAANGANGTITYSTTAHPPQQTCASKVSHLPDLNPEPNRRVERATAQPENPYSSLIPDQTFAIIPEFELESGVVLQNVSVAYKTYGTLSPARDNAMVICHALTGSADVGDWWGPLLGGPGKAFDTSRFFVVCMNSLGSPYGSASPVTARDGEASSGRYGPEFPLTTVRDDVK